MAKRKIALIGGGNIGGVQAQLIDVDVPAREVVGEARREVRRAGNRARAFRGEH